MPASTEPSPIVRPKIAPEDACEFGFHIQACNQSWVKVNLETQPLIGEGIARKEIPLRMVKPFENGVVLVDACLMCHLNHGYTPKQYIRIEQALIEGKTWKRSA